MTYDLTPSKQQGILKLTDLHKEFTAYALLERCLEPTTIVWYDGNIKCFAQIQTIIIFILRVSIFTLLIKPLGVKYSNLAHIKSV